MVSPVCKLFALQMRAPYGSNRPRNTVGQFEAIAQAAVAQW